MSATAIGFDNFLQLRHAAGGWPDALTWADVMNEKMRPDPTAEIKISRAQRNRPETALGAFAQTGNVAFFLSSN